jgi:hypothetical protein
MRRRSLLAMALVAGIFFFTSQPALAKLPPWTCEVSTTRPVVGQPVGVEVRFWNDADHTDPATWWDLRGIPDFLEAHSIGRGRTGELGVVVLDSRVELVRPGVYRGQLVFPDARRFRVPRCGGPYELGYPSGAIIVRPRAFFASDPGKAAPAPARTATSGVITIAALGITVAALLRRRVRDRPA